MKNSEPQKKMFELIPKLEIRKTRSSVFMFSPKLNTLIETNAF